MSGYTKGPWGDSLKPVIVRGLTFVSHANYETEEGSANARLIAAAPDLLEAAKSADSWLNRWASHVGGCSGGNLCTCGLTMVRLESSAAIARATGEA